MRFALFCCTLFLMFSCSVFLRAHAQFNIKFKTEELAIGTKYKYNNKPKDSVEAVSLLNELVKKFHADGHLLASYSNLEWTKAQEVDFAIGPKFEWLALKLGNFDNDLLRRTRLKERDFTSKPVNPNQLSQLEEGLLDIAENQGFPFARISYDSLSIRNNLLGASLNLSLGPEIRFDSVQVTNNRPLKSKFVSAYLGIRKGQLYDQTVIDGVVRRLNRLSYVRLTESPELLFSNNEGQLKINMENRPINTIDGVIGFLPNNSRENGLLITGQFDLELYNPFFTGKYIGIHWRRLSEETPRIQLEYEHPNLFSSPISVSGDFNFLRQDTTFTRRDFTVDLSYNLGVNSQMSFITEIRGTDLQAASRFQDATTLPEIADYDLTSYGLSFDFNYLDDPIRPKSGFLINFNGAVGTKKIRPNADLPAELYQNIPLNSAQYQFDFNGEFYLPVSKNLVLYKRFKGGHISNDRLFLNDAYRLGGLRSIRGFAESIFFATSYLYTNIEGRLIFDGQSYLSAFIDLGAIDENFIENDANDRLLGFGLGINFTTASGIFNFVYALGTSEQTGPINFNQSKIHFGYTTSF